MYTGLKMRKTPWYRTAQAFSGNMYSPISSLWSGWALLVIGKTFGEKLVEVKWILVGVKVHAVDPSEITCFICTTKRVFVGIHKRCEQYYIHVNIHIRISIYIYLYMHMYVYMYMYIYVFIYSVCVQIYMYIHIYMYIFIYMYIYTHTYKCMHIYTHVFTYIYVRIHMEIFVELRKGR